MPSSSAPSTCRIRTFEPVASSALSNATSCLFGERRDARAEVQRHHARPRQQLDAAAPRTSRPAGTGCPRATPRRAGSPSRAAAGCRAGPSSRPTSRISPSAPCSRRWRAQLPAAMPPPTSRYSTERSAHPGIVRGSALISPAICSPLSSWRKCAPPSITRSSSAPGIEVDEPLPGLGREDRIRVGEADERGLLPARQRVARPRSSRPRRRRLARAGRAAGTAADAGLRLGASARAPRRRR